ncbi:protein FAR1-RELATED SEQUENCE 5-like [Salvia miltiorrhiza]|uniref:protein FAR1-RELATED SEQUENCE 5-like n=1 Tax=Salvia miltiorrhiza TaxID=226208 RepID=UPI0025AD9012|nr:protein FAR1-RELATED SEQUENCE 5-like [Salvia miltiorrhiza]
MDFSSDLELKPRIGMQFDSLDEVWMFWVQYGGKSGFGVRKHYSNKNKKTGHITSYKYVCCKEGIRKADKRDSLALNPRLETRTDCKVRLGVTYMDGKYKINEFIEEHNHPLHLPETVHMLSSQRKITEIQAHEIDLAEDAGLRQKSAYNLLIRRAGGRDGIGYTMLDAKNYLRSKRQRSMVYGEAGCLMRYFQQKLSENPSFYHANQMDMEEQITNVFWADARMLIDYEYFGDVVSLDTTYCTNRANRPLAIFSGFNHHRKAVIFGASLLYDETAASFKWLFETFLEAHKQKKPFTVFTDQDQAMAKALHEVLPETAHGLCTWHLMQNGIKHLGNLMKEGSRFLTDFKRCMYSFDDQAQFEEAWSSLLTQYSLQDNTWLKHVYSVKEKWAGCYMNAFTLGMRSTQLSESVNSDIKKCMKPNLNIMQFFNNFEQVVEEKRYSELRCDFEARQKLPRLSLESSPMLQQLSKVYTPSVFDLFQKEFVLFAAAYIKHKQETPSSFEYVIGLINHDREWRVTHDPNTKMLICSCRRFEMVGLICCHIVKVYDVMDIKILPEHYILKRWTREARSGVVQDYVGNEVEEDPKLQSTERYRKLCRMLIRLATEACIYPSTFSLVHETMHDLSKKVMEMRLMEDGQENKNSVRTSPSISSMPSRRFKQRIGMKGSKRLKSWVELQSKRNKTNHRVKNLGAKSALSASCSTPPEPNVCLQRATNQFSFTDLLTAPLHQSLHYVDGMYFNGDTSSVNIQDQDF